MLLELLLFIFVAYLNPVINVLVEQSLRRVTPFGGPYVSR